MSLKEKMDKLKRVLSGQEDDDEQNIVSQASVNRLIITPVVNTESCRKQNGKHVTHVRIGLKLPVQK